MTKNCFINVFTSPWQVSEVSLYRVIKVQTTLIIILQYDTESKEKSKKIIEYNTEYFTYPGTS